MLTKEPVGPACAKRPSAYRILYLGLHGSHALVALTCVAFGIHND